ncbi:hypothetical protein A9179_13540 [Pseudomonas alcaligenes]|uniref:eCIS core domain-containing protein n=1 Tax=Aquipseudomonas alcaligenes TaxID=43263 RepID=A0ABR7S4G1_AQUAC|nr:DUF4157 domain-containing protein [Pseudomonas alcaligenes]MBC9251293.1 hypothetical protein [Pseudomonas alcaligenes]
MPLPAPAVRLCSLLLLALPLVAQADACPPGQYQVCLGSCLCIEDPDQIIGPTYESALQMSAATLEAWILEARENSIRQGTQPIPAAIRQQLLPYYPAQILDGARYKVGSGEELDLAAGMLQNPDIAAVTLVDNIIFRNEQDALGNAALWAHELWHVQQYREWGSHLFAQRYTRDFNAVEAPAYQIQARVRLALRQAGSSPAAP